MPTFGPTNREYYRTSLWSDKTAMGFLLHHDQKEHPTRLFRYGNDLYGLQPPADIKHTRYKPTQSLPKGIGPSFSTSQQPFKAIFSLRFRCDLAQGIFLPFCFGLL